MIPWMSPAPGDVWLSPGAVCQVECWGHREKMGKTDIGLNLNRPLTHQS